MAKPNTKQENNAIAKAARNAIAKSVLDISELNIAFHGGNIELYGKLRPPRGHSGELSMKKEVEHLKQMIMSVRGVRDITTTRVIILE